MGTPNFTRGTIGKDKGVFNSNVDGPVIDKKKRDTIATFSKATHFSFSVNAKRE